MQHYAVLYCYYYVLLIPTMLYFSAHLDLCGICFGLEDIFIAKINLDELWPTMDIVSHCNKHPRLNEFGVQVSEGEHRHENERHGYGRFNERRRLR